MSINSTERREAWNRWAEKKNARIEEGEMAAQQDQSEVTYADAMAESNPGVRFPEVFVQLTGEDGNVFSMIGRVRVAMRRARTADGERIVSSEEQAEFTKEVTAAQSYHEAIQIIEAWVLTG